VESLVLAVELSLPVGPARRSEDCPVAEVHCDDCACSCDGKAKGTQLISGSFVVIECVDATMTMKLSAGNLISCDQSSGGSIDVV